MDPSLIPILGLALILFFSPSSGPSKRSSPKKSTRSYSHAVKHSGASVPSVSINSRTFSSEKEYQTIFKYIRTKYPNVSVADAEKISKYLVQYGKEHNVDPKFVAAVMARESAFNKKAVSSTGAKGLGQIKDFNYKSLKIKDPYNIKQNVSGTVTYLKKLNKRWKGNSKQVSLSLASYYKGPNAIKASKGQYDSQTAGYVNDILKNYEDIKKARKRYR